jgi:hypothetical protein
MHDPDDSGQSNATAEEADGFHHALRRPTESDLPV